MLFEEKNYICGKVNFEDSRRVARAEVRKSYGHFIFCFFKFLEFKDTKVFTNSKKLYIELIKLHL